MWEEDRGYVGSTRRVTRTGSPESTASHGSDVTTDDRNVSGRRGALDYFLTFLSDRTRPSMLHRMESPSRTPACRAKDRGMEISIVTLFGVSLIFLTNSALVIMA